MVRKNLHLGIYITLLFVAGFIYYFYHPSHYQLFPKCLFKSVTGLSCPGCGSQRAAHELLHLNFKSAFSYNPLLLFAIPYALVGLLFYQTDLKKKFPTTKEFLFGKYALIVVAVIVILFFIFRNL